MTQLIDKQTFYLRNWDGPNRIRRFELEELANYFKLEFNSTNSNFELFDKISNYFQLDSLSDNISNCQITNSLDIFILANDFYKRNWDGNNRLRRNELEFMANSYDISFTKSHLNKDIFDKIDNYLKKSFEYNKNKKSHMNNLEFLSIVYYPIFFDNKDDEFKAFSKLPQIINKRQKLSKNNFYSKMVFIKNGESKERCYVFNYYQCKCNNCKVCIKPKPNLYFNKYESHNGAECVSCFKHLPGGNLGDGYVKMSKKFFEKNGTDWSCSYCDGYMY